MVPNRGGGLRATAAGAGSDGKGRDQGALRVSSDGAMSWSSDAEDSRLLAVETDDNDASRVAVRRCEACGYLCSGCVGLHRRLRILVPHRLHDMQAQV